MTLNTSAQYAYCEFQRHTGEVVYQYDLEPNGDYRRRDKALWIRFKSDAGWVVVGEDDSVILSWPFDPELAMDTSHPPACEWRSQKGEKSFRYSLVYPTLSDG